MFKKFVVLGALALAGIHAGATGFHPSATSSPITSARGASMPLATGGQLISARSAWGGLFKYWLDRRNGRA